MNSENRKQISPTVLARVHAGIERYRRDADDGQVVWVNPLPALKLAPVPEPVSTSRMLQTAANAERVIPLSGFPSLEKILLSALRAAAREQAEPDAETTSAPRPDYGRC